MAEDIDGDQLTIAHRQSGMMLIFTLVLIGFLTFVATGGFGGDLILLTVLFVLPAGLLSYVVRGYFNRESWALPWVSTIWTIAIVCVSFSVFGNLQSLLQATLGHGVTSKDSCCCIYVGQ